LISSIYLSVSSRARLRGQVVHVHSAVQHCVGTVRLGLRF
jgi:hypothetical protein